MSRGPLQICPHRDSWKTRFTRKSEVKALLERQQACLLTYSVASLKHNLVKQKTHHPKLYFKIHAFTWFENSYTAI